MLTNPVIDNLLIALALFAVFAWCVRRGILNAKEVVWIGTALGFFAASRVFNAVLERSLPAYGGHIWALLGITLAMVVPFVLALTYGIWALYRSVIARELAVVTLDGLTLRLVLGNIAALKRSAEEPPLDALVNPANTLGRMGAGVAGALKSFGGAQIEREVRAKAPLKIGQAVATSAGRLQAKHVIHAAVMGPDYRTDPDKIKKALDGALKCAKKIGARRIALPAFGTGVGNVPAATVAPLTLEAVLRVRQDFDEIVLVAFHSRVATAFQAEFAKLGESPTPAR